jgi:ectoine hydroxylase-related dioxygenase (phytanoyl-CoA dioxygenase family)
MAADADAASSPAETAMPATAAAPVLAPAAFRRFRDEGFAAIPELIPRDDALAGRAAALALSAQEGRAPVLRSDAIMHQVMNVWRVDPTLRALTLHPRLLAAVNAFAQRPMRLWHDQLFIKPAGESLPTEFHQDLPYWPVERDAFTVSAWIALGDVDEDCGCLAFIPGSHTLRGGESDLTRRDSLVGMYPELAFAERVAIPLRAGGSTFHQGYTAHRAGANRAPAPRIALSVIFIAADTRCTAQGHALTHEYALRPGEPFPDRFCPPI